MLTGQEILLTLKHTLPELKKFGISEIGLFGSYAMGEQTEKSDIDILINFEAGKTTLKNYMEVCDVLETVFKGKKVDIITKEGLSPYFRPYIIPTVQYV